MDDRDDYARLTTALARGLELLAAETLDRTLSEAERARLGTLRARLAEVCLAVDCRAAISGQLPMPPTPPWIQ